jgi:hypothetical protein
MARTNSSRGMRRRGRLSGGNRPRTHPSAYAAPARTAKRPAKRRPKPRGPLRSDLYAILGHFATALAIVETTARAFEAVENEREAATVGAEICTLRHGVDALRTVYTEIDLAILGAPA